MFLTFTVADLFIILIGVVLVLKKVAEMDRYLALRVFVFTSILSCLVFYFFLYGLTPSYQFDCVISFSDVEG